MADIPGKYIHKKSASHFIELKPDGSYILFDGATTLTGAYEVNVGTLTAPFTVG